MKVLKNKSLLDFGERTVATFVQAFLAVEVVDPSKLTDVTKLKVAGVAGVLAAGKFVFAKVNAYLAKPDAPVA